VKDPEILRDTQNDNKNELATPEELASLDDIVEIETQNSEIENESEPNYEDIFTPQAVTSANEDEITQAIKSIDDEIEGVVTPEVTPNIDIQDNVSKKEALQQIGEVIRGYNPGRPIEEKGEQPVDTTVWK